MQHSTHAQPSITSLLLMWAFHHLPQRVRAMRTKNRAFAAAALAAGSGNPPGA